MGYMLRNLVYCGAVCFAVVSALGDPYEVRFWRRTNTSQVAYGVAYDTIGGLFEQLSEDGWEFKPVSWLFADGRGWCSDCACSLFQSRTTSPKHYIDNQSNSGLDWALVNNDRQMWIVPSGIALTSNHTITNCLDGYTGFKLRRCSVCAGEVPANDATGRYIEYTMVVQVLDTSLIPKWAWSGENFKKFKPTFASETSTTITGYSGEIATENAPDGAIQSGDHQNGEWVFDENTAPHWVYYPGMEPETGGGDDGGETDLSGVMSAIAGVDGSIDSGFSAVNGWLQTMDGRLVEIAAGTGMLENLITQMTTTLHNDLANMGSGGSVSVDLSGVVGAIGGVQSAVSSVGSAVAGVDATVAGFRADSAGHWASLGDNMKVWVKDGVSDLKTSVDAIKEAVTDQSGDTSLSAYTPVAMTPIEDFTEHDVSVTDVGENDGVFSSGFSLFSEFEAPVLSVQGKITDLANSLVGGWRYLGRVPPVDIQFWDDTVISLDMLKEMFAILRPIEVVALWCIFLFAIMRLLNSAFGGV